VNRAEPFKTTEVGEIPESWEVDQLGDVFDVKQGKAMSPHARTGTSPRPFLRTSNVLWGRLDLSSLDQMDFTFDEAERLSLLPDDLLVCEGGEIGRTAIWKGAVEGCLYQNHIHRLRAKQSDVSPDFVMYWMQAAFLYLRLYGGVGNKTTIPNLSGARLKSLPVPLPPVPEQRAIAAVLSKIQAAVEVQEKIVATFRELKAATMAKLFREGLRGELLKQTKIGEIPESWEVMRLGEVTSIERGKFAHRPRNEPRFYGGAIPFIQTGDVAKSNGRIRTYSQTLNEEGLAISRLFPKGTIVLTIAANIADTAILEFDSAFPDSLVGITPDGTMDAAFLEYYLRTQKADMDRLAPKGTQKNININFLRPWPTPRPSIEEQQEIAHSLRCLDVKLEMAFSRRDTLKSLFSSMLHLLMTGRVRVTPKMIALQRVADWAARRAKWSGKVDEKVLEQVVKRIVEAVAPEKIILFGSAARGEMGPDSDLDLLIVKSDVHRLATAQMIEHSLIGITIPTDIVVATPKDIEAHKNTIGLIYRPALQEGKILYAA